MKKYARPRNFREFVGQSRIKKILKIMIDSSLNQHCSIDHILIYGPQGTGKTTLAEVIANERKANIKHAQGPLLEKKSDMLVLLSNIKKGDIIFIDEMHGINKNIEELLYSALEENVIDIPFGPDGDIKIVRMKIPDFTLIGATTKLDKISKPLRERFGLIKKIEEYKLVDIQKISRQFLNNKKILFEEEAIIKLSLYCNLNPRKCINILKRTIDYTISKNEKIITKFIILKIISILGIHKHGLIDEHFYYLKYLQNLNYASIDLMSGWLNMSKQYIENELEPPLIKMLYIEKTSRGRSITELGKSKIKNQKY